MGVQECLKSERLGWPQERITSLDSCLAMSKALLATLLGIELADDFLYVVHGERSRHDEKINRALEHA